MLLLRVDALREMATQCPMKGLEAGKLSRVRAMCGRPTSLGVGNDTTHTDSTRDCGVRLKHERFSHLSYRSFGLGSLIRLG